LIENIKTDFRSEIESPFKKKISEARGKAEALAVKILNLKTFGENADKQMLADHEKAVEALAKLERERDEVIANKIYENAFEWRFEFPEVLNDDGDFVGFDVVIGNPPYVGVRQIEKSHRDYYSLKYQTAKDQFDLYVIFIEKSFEILKNKGYFSFITPDKFLQSKYGEYTFSYLSTCSTPIAFWDLTKVNVFEEASVYPVVTILQKSNTISKFTPDTLFEIEITGLKYENWYKKIEKIDKPKLDFEVWRPLATSKNIVSGNGSIIANGNIQRFQLNYQPNSITVGHREIDIISPKILLKKLCYNLEASIDFNNSYPINTTYCITTNSDEDLYYLLGLINSKLFSYYARNKYSSTALRGGYIELRVFQIKELPIYDWKNKGLINNLVRNILEIKAQNSSDDTTELENRIDLLVYQLYDLTEEEINIIETA
jgi:hypothetical protein